MTRVFHVAPFDGGWCVKICDTGGEAGLSNRGYCNASKQKHN